MAPRAGGVVQEGARRAGGRRRARLGERERDLCSGARLPAVPATTRAGGGARHRPQAADPAGDPDGAGAPRREEPGLGRARGGAGGARAREPHHADRPQPASQRGRGARRSPLERQSGRGPAVDRRALGGDRGEGQRSRHRRRDPAAPVRAGRQRQARRAVARPRAGDLPRAGPRRRGRDLGVVAAHRLDPVPRRAAAGAGNPGRVPNLPRGLGERARLAHATSYRRIVDERAGSGSTRSSFPCHQA